MKPIRIYTNFRATNGLSGGANSFMRSLISELEKRGFRFGFKLKSEYDLVFLNALSDGVSPSDAVYWKRERGLPVIHRKVGYTVSGGPEMREKVNGVPRGERIQLEFDPSVDLTIFQSEWSRGEFLRAGFEGQSEVIRNGVSSEVFHPRVKNGLWPWSSETIRKPWGEGGKFKIAISSWSTDMNKGFSEYARLDKELAAHPDYEFHFFGRVPEQVGFSNIVTHGALPHRKLARALRECHGVFTLSKNETCSNSLIEALSCGLPAVYLDSGSNRELAGPYGIEFQGDFWSAFSELRKKYKRFFSDLTKSSPFPIEKVADHYESVFKNRLAT